VRTCWRGWSTGCQSTSGKHEQANQSNLKRAGAMTSARVQARPSKLQRKYLELADLEGQGQLRRLDVWCAVDKRCDGLHARTKVTTAGTRENNGCMGNDRDNLSVTDVH
jgi:hypothetical protein